VFSGCIFGKFVALYINRADNYEQPVIAELKPDNIVMLHGSFLRVIEAKNDCLVATDLLEKGSTALQYPYDNIIGLDLKNWITSIDIKHVIDSVILSNGFTKHSTGFCLFKYAKGGVEIHNAGYDGSWYIKNGSDKTPVSFLHEIQNILQLSLDKAF
jgi:hypothetical protein